MFKLRRYQSNDLNELCQLFYQTINVVNCRDYNEEQIKAWSSGYERLLNNHEFFDKLHTIVAYNEKSIVGYGNISESGYLDHLYVHHGYQNQKIATAICNQLETYVKNKVNEIEVHASITSKPFFEKRGYVVVKEQEVAVQGIKLKNYVMKKIIRGD